MNLTLGGGAVVGSLSSCQVWNGTTALNNNTVLNTLVAGQKVSTFNAGTDQYNVRVRAIGQSRASVAGLKQMIVSSAKIGLVSLDNLVRIEEIGRAHV